ncbi:crotonase/enoyl-CoA hydratase family protein [Ornithinimicrobium sufpigmenti]|uniref:crotonase/enoyl-CoA hydratase family protein n=1 Tax=Ornithinimicrobium sufpigmenti TaxID=2508882 RepID=UPI001035C784|nr:MULTISPECIES: crotonase/enoyl-CoA hydratase family protein [unclassified Ornithinimicrobium]
MPHRATSATFPQPYDPATDPPVPSEGTIVVEIVEDIAFVGLRRPDKLNALTLSMLDSLVDVAPIFRRRRNRHVRAVVLHGEGEAFCAGMDLGHALKDPVGIARRFVSRPWLGTNVFQEACWAWRRLPVPVVAAVHGHCLGAGLQLALGADLRVSTPDARWSVREAHWGLTPDMSGTRSLSEVVGLDVAQELTLSARVLPGDEAARLGLVTRLADDPIAGAVELLAPILANDPQAVAAGKRLLTTARASSPRRAFARERRAQLALLARMGRRGLPVR